MDQYQTTTITKKFQVHIPVGIRKQIGLSKPGPADITVKNNQIVITPTRSPIHKLVGSLSHHKPAKKVDIANIRDLIDYSDI